MKVQANLSLKKTSRPPAPPPAASSKEEPTQPDDKQSKRYEDVNIRYQNDIGLTEIRK